MRLKAEILGSTGLTMLVRCSCSRRKFFDRGAWEEFGAMRCDNCGDSIMYHSLDVIRGGYMPVTLTPPSQDELEALRAIEVTLRAFVVTFDSFPERMWGLQTIRMVNQVRPELRKIDVAREAEAA